MLQIKTEERIPTPFTLGADSITLDSCVYYDGGGGGGSGEGTVLGQLGNQNLLYQKSMESMFEHLAVTTNVRSIDVRSKDVRSKDKDFNRTFEQRNNNNNNHIHNNNNNHRPNTSPPLEGRGIGGDQISAKKWFVPVAIDSPTSSTIQRSQGSQRSQRSQRNSFVDNDNDNDLLRRRSPSQIYGKSKK